MISFCQFWASRVFLSDELVWLKLSLRLNKAVAVSIQSEVAVFGWVYARISFCASRGVFLSDELAWPCYQTRL